MKRLMLPAALALTLAGSMAFAQQAPATTPDASMPTHRHAPNPQKETEHLTKALNLTPDQAAKIEPILADRQQKMEALQSNTALTDEQRREQMRAIHKSSEEQFKSILTPDQLAQMKTMHQGREHGHDHGDGASQTMTPPSA